MTVQEGGAAPAVSGLVDQEAKATFTNPDFAKRHGVQQVQLPSLGKPYGGSLPEGLVYISAITTAEEKVIGSSAASSENKINVLYTQSCDLRGLKAADLVAPDRFFLLMQLRALSYGNTYGFQFMCEHCDHQFRHQVNLLTDMETKEIAEDWEEPFSMELPVSHYMVDLRSIRGSDEMWIEKTLRKLGHERDKNHHFNATLQGNSYYVMVMARALVRVNDKPLSDFAAIQLMESLAVMDSHAIRDKLNEMSFGYIPELQIDCPNCGFVNEARLPIGREFFRATLAG